MSAAGTERANFYKQATLYRQATLDKRATLEGCHTCRGTTMKALTIRTIGALLLCLPASLALAHHSFAMFDQSQKVTHNGKITEVQWTNPHVWIFVDVPVENGVTERWGM